jgi:hypothetical protein
VCSLRGGGGGGENEKAMALRQLPCQRGLGEWEKLALAVRQIASPAEEGGVSTVRMPHVRCEFASGWGAGVV